jgi:2'-5' RNA ligase
LTDRPRLFVAVPLDADARGAVESLVERVRATEPAGRGVRWVRLDGLHLTLRFIGPTEEAQLPDLTAAMRTAGAGVAPTRIRLAGTGAFPSAARPRALWLGVSDGADRLAELAARLDDALHAAGWTRDERPFRAHLTLARADGVRAGPKTAATLGSMARELAIDSAIDRLVLFESVTGGGPARYVARAETPLG